MDGRPGLEKFEPKKCISTEKSFGKTHFKGNTKIGKSLKTVGSQHQKLKKKDRFI